jgi:hypothetical protein
MGGRVERTRLAHLRIRAVLRQWDPIGVSAMAGAEGEYDAYASEVYQLLARRPTQQQVFDQLWSLETQSLGLSGDRANTQRAAQTLIDVLGDLDPGRSEDDDAATGADEAGGSSAGEAGDASAAGAGGWREGAEADRLEAQPRGPSAMSSSSASNVSSLVDKALAMTEERMVDGAGSVSAMFSSIKNQLRFMRETIDAGRSPTTEEKNRLTLDVIAVREFENSDLAYCDALCDATYEFRKL